MQIKDGGLAFVDCGNKPEGINIELGSFILILIYHAFI